MPYCCIQGPRKSDQTGGTGEAISPHYVHDMHEWFPASAISSWRSPTKWERPELVAVVAAAVRTPDFLWVTLPRLLRNLRLRTREDAELECALQQLHRTPAQPATAATAATTGAEQSQQPDVPAAQEQPASVPPEIADGASSYPAAI